VLSWTSTRRASFAGAAFATSLVALLSGVGPTVASADPVRGAENITSPGDSLRVAATEQQARSSAATNGARVENLSARTATTQSFVNPDGTLSRRIAAAPVRFRDATAPNGWRDLDLALRLGDDGMVRPVGSPLDLKFAGGGSAGGTAIAQLTATDGKTVSVEWPEPLPSPTISGDKIVYPNVRPDIDLELQATRTGFEQFFVLKKRPKSGTTPTFSLNLNTPQLRVDDGSRGTDGQELLDSSGEAIAQISPAATWDASGTESGERSRFTVSPSEVRNSHGASMLVLTPSESFLQDPLTTYPVTVDPEVYLTGGAMGTAYISSSAPNSTFDGGLYLPAGIDSSTTYRSFVGFDLGDYTEGVNVLSSTLYIRSDLSGGCTPTTFSVFGISGTQTRPVNITWANQPAVNDALRTDVSSAAGGGSACPSDYVSADTTAQLREVTSTQSPYFTLGLRSEAADSSFRLFDSMSHSYPPVLDVSYEETPIADETWTEPTPEASSTTPSADPSETYTIEGDNTAYEGGEFNANRTSPPSNEAGAVARYNPVTIGACNFGSTNTVVTTFPSTDDGTIKMFCGTDTTNGYRHIRKEHQDDWQGLLDKWKQPGTWDDLMDWQTRYALSHRYGAYPGRMASNKACYSYPLYVKNSRGVTVDTYYTTTVVSANNRLLITSIPTHAKPSCKLL
jgi:hypothetical protein